MLATVREHAIELGGLSFRYWETGPLAAMPIVLLHAIGAGADDWLETAMALADRYHVIALDQRGHGRSARPGDYSFELMRDDVAALIDELGLVQPILIGHSMADLSLSSTRRRSRSRPSARDRRHPTTISITVTVARTRIRPR